jgi:hypothetical protein
MANDAMDTDCLTTTTSELLVGTLFYKNYALTPGAIRDEESGNYAPTVHIAWRGRDGKRDARSFTLTDRCSTFHAASRVASAHAKAWAERWLTPSEPAANWTAALKAVNLTLVKHS